MRARWCLRAAGLTGLFVLVACSRAPDTSKEDAQLAAAYHTSSTGNVASLESKVLATSHGRVRRLDDTLILILSGGKNLTLRNDTPDCSGDIGHLDRLCGSFLMLADLPNHHFYLVCLIEDESVDYLLIDDRTGHETLVDAVPIFSADGTHFLVQNDDEMNDHDNNLEIWRRENDGAVLEWAHSVMQASAEAPSSLLYHTDVTSWRDNRINLTFSLGKNFDSERKRIVPAQHWAGTITRENGKWQLQANWPKSK